MLTSDRLAELEYEAVQQEKRDKLNSRLQVWSLLVGLVGAFGVASGWYMLAVLVVVAAVAVLVITCRFLKEGF